MRALTSIPAIADSALRMRTAHADRNEQLIIADSLPDEVLEEALRAHRAFKDKRIDADNHNAFIWNQHELERIGEE